MRLLIAENEVDFNRILSKKLCAEGYSVDSCFDGEEAIKYSGLGDYDAIILDIALPKADGFEVLKKIRDDGKKTPVLLIIARDAVIDRVVEQDDLADDYLSKPFSFNELKARVRAMIRASFNEPTKILRLADLEVDTVSHIVRRSGRTILLSVREYSLLEYLMVNKYIVLSREKLEKHIWNLEYDGYTNVIDVYISYLRRKIDNGHDVKLIHTVRGCGYVMREK